MSTIQKLKDSIVDLLQEICTEVEGSSLAGPIWTVVEHKIPDLQEKSRHLAGLLDDSREPTQEELVEVRSLLRELISGSFEGLQRYDPAVGVGALRLYMKERSEIPMEAIRWFAKQKGASIPRWARELE